MGDETKFFLVDTTVNWADELDVCGYAIYNGAELQKMIDYVSKKDDDWTHTVYLGTNEEAELNKKDVLEMLNDAVPISAEQMTFLKDKLWQCENDIFEEIYIDEDEDSPEYVEYPEG